MRIEVMSARCAKCKRLEVAVRRTVHDLEVPADIIIVTDFETIRSRRIMRLPALCVDGKTVLTGNVPGLNELKDLILGSIEQEN